MQKLVNEVYWLNNQTFSNGSQIGITAKRQVEWINPLITPGQAVITWKSVYNYQGDKTVPQLPILKSGSRYRIYAHISSQPVDSYIIRLTFYNLQGTEIKRVELRSRQKNFIFPTDAVSYQIEIISAGMTAMEFDRLDICSTDMPSEVHDDIWVHEPINESSMLPPNIIIMKDSKQARKTHPELIENAAYFPIQLISINWQYDGNVITWLKKWLDQRKFSKFHLVSTSPELDELVWSINKQYRNSECLLADIHSGAFIDYQVWNYLQQSWQTPDICEPDWFRITQTMKNVWGRELIDNV
ncbi:MAG: accessory Sec system protein Asp3 [Candidatus Limosilactobacillus intestinavium]